jgi:tetratricopeptide (TPR) repeat protein
MMNPLFVRGTAVLLALLLLSACSHETPLRSMRQEQAIEFNQHAQRAFLRGEYQVAASLYENALQLDSAIENVDGIAVNLLNLAKVNQALGKQVTAQQYLDRLLTDKALHFPSSHLAAAAVQYGFMRLQAGDISAAKSWADKASEYCTADCKLSGVIANLRANIAIQSNDAEQALYWSGRAVTTNKGEAQIEYANALRLLAQAKLLKQEFEAALPLLEEALVLDKTLGLPEKIRQDLSLLAQAQDKLGRTESAAQYRERAARISSTSVK